MHYSYLIPDWFFGFDIGMEILFSIVTFAIAIYSWKIYNLTKERKIKLFGIAFALIGFSYLIWAFANIWFVSVVSDGIKSVNLENFIFLDTFAAYSFMILFTLGLVFIVYISCDLKEVKSFSLILGLSLMVIGASHYKLVTFRILSVFLLLFIVMRYLNEYAQKKTKNSLAVLVAFTFLLIGSVDFMFSSSYYQTYVAGHFLELSAYLILLVVLIISVKQKN
jgi:hypothetical protein